MATRLYFHNAFNTNKGIFNQGQTYGTAGMFGIAYGNGIYARASNTQVQLSTNGIDWDDPIAVGTNTVELFGCAFGNGYFMATNRNNGVFRSTDGVNWTLVRAESGGTEEVLVYIGNYWLMGGDSSGTTHISVSGDDGNTWTSGLGNFPAGSVSTFFGYNPTTGEYAMCGYVSATNAGLISKTTNPLGTWTTVTPPVAASRMGTITWNASNGLWIAALGDTTTPGIYTTPTLSASPTWTSRTLSGVSGPNRTIWATTNGSLTLIVGIGVIYNSTDGTTWTNLYSTANIIPDISGSNEQSWYAIAYDNTYYYIMTRQGTIWRSADGTTWNRVSGPLSNTVENIGNLGATPPSTVYKLRSMNTTIGTAQSSLSMTTWASTATQNGFMGFFCSDPLFGSQTVGGGTMILNVADSEGNQASNWWINGICIYVWRPSTGKIVGYIIDYQGTPIGGTEPSAASSEQVTNITGITTSAVLAQNQDVIICEIWATATQGMGTAYTNTVYFDGTTVNTTENAVVTSQASFVELSESLLFLTSSIDGNMLMSF